LVRIQAYFEKKGFSFDYVLYSSYERQVEALIDGVIHVAWNVTAGLDS
jgi:hypothetical protein